MQQNLEKLSKHQPKNTQYQSLDEFGYYLAGLIDGDGHFNKQGYCVIAFNPRDRQLAQDIRKRLGHGDIKTLKGKRTVYFVISNSEGMLLLATLICHKLKHSAKIEQFNTRVASKFSLVNTSTDTTINFDSPWLAGFIDADGQLSINITSRNEVRLQLKIDQKSDEFLMQIRQYFGGYLGHRASQNSYYYSSTSFRNMRKVLEYLDRFSPKSAYKCLQYILMRKSYLIIQEKSHLTDEGLSQVQKFIKKLSIAKEEGFSANN